jgi:predicted nucleic acid-binding protein
VIVFDTNLLVRLATNDVAADRAAVINLLETQSVLLLKTVLLETEWVLRSRYDYEPAQVMDFFSYLANLASVIIEDQTAVDAAISHARAGLDFADALHLACADGRRFMTLDKALQRKAKRIKGVKVALLSRAS